MKKSKILLVLFIASFVLFSCEDEIEGPKISNAYKLEGQWKCDENSDNLKSVEDAYFVYISLSETDSTKVIISNFYDLDNAVEATAKVNGNKITLDNQTLTGGFSIRGSGTISDKYNSINWIYYVDDASGQEETFSATYTLQY